MNRTLGNFNNHEDDFRSSKIGAAEFLDRVLEGADTSIESARRSNLELRAIVHGRGEAFVERVENVHRMILALKRTFPGIRKMADLMNLLILTRKSRLKGQLPTV